MIRPVEPASRIWLYSSLLGREVRKAGDVGAVPHFLLSYMMS
jgi:hypothetical protein